MGRMIYLFFSTDAFVVSDGETPLKTFKINNGQQIISTKVRKQWYNPETKKKEEIEIFENVKESNYQYIPNVSAFYSAMNMLEANKIGFKQFLKKEFFLSKIFQPTIVAMIPDSSIVVDQRCVTDFLWHCGFNKIFLIEECMCLTSMEEPHFTLTKSFRALTLSLIENGGLRTVAYFDKNFEDRDEIAKKIHGMAKHLESSKFPVFLYGDGIEYYKDLGTLVKMEEILKILAKRGALKLP